MNRLIRWMQKHKIPLDASVLDIGTGNGVFLVELVGTFNIHVFEPIFKMKVFSKNVAVKRLPSKCEIAKTVGTL